MNDKEENSALLQPILGPHSSSNGNGLQRRNSGSVVRSDGSVRRDESMRGESSFFLVRNAKKLVRRKRVQDIIAENIAEANNGEGLKRSLTALDLIAYGIGATVGAGLFVVTGEAAKTLAGPSVSLSFVVAALSGLLSAFCYAEFATRIPVAGGAYAYSYVCFGEAVAWLVGWNLTLEYGMSASVVARGFADYLVSFLQAIGYKAPFWMNNIPLDIPFTSKNGSVLASLIVLVCTGALLMGASESARLNVIITILNMALILFIVVAGFSEVDTANYTPFFSNGAGGVMTGAGFVFFSYVGFDCICILAEELKNPKKDLPIAIVGTLMVVAVLYVAVSLVLTGMVPYAEIDLSAPLSEAFMQNGMRWAAVIVAFGTTTILTSTTLCSLFGQPRVFFAMAKDGLVPQKLAKLNPRTKVPEFSTILCGIISAILAFALDINSLAGMISAGTMLSFTMVSLGILVVRYEDAPESRKATRWYKKHTFWLSLFCVLNVVLGVLMNYLPNCPMLLVIFLSALTLAPICVLACFPQQDINGGKRTASGHLQDQENAASEGVFTGEVFACPWVPWIPALAVVVNIHLILSLETDTLVKVALWAALGYFFYFVYGFHNSKLNNHTSYRTL